MHAAVVTGPVVAVVYDGSAQTTMALETAVGVAGESGATLFVVVGLARVRLSWELAARVGGPALGPWPRPDPDEVRALVPAEIEVHVVDGLPNGTQHTIRDLRRAYRGAIVVIKR